MYLVCGMANLVFGFVYLEFGTVGFVSFAIPLKVFTPAWTFFIAVVMRIFKSVLHKEFIQAAKHFDSS